jgi:hypothetical protein
MNEQQSVEQPDRVARLAAEIGGVRVRGGAIARERALARLGAVAMGAGVALAVVGYVLSHGTDNALQQRDAIVLGLLGVTVAVSGAAVYLRYSLGQLLRFWLARLVLDRET